MTYSSPYTANAPSYDDWVSPTRRQQEPDRLACPVSPGCSSALHVCDFISIAQHGSGDAPAVLPAAPAQQVSHLQSRPASGPVQASAQTAAACTTVAAQDRSGIHCCWTASGPTPGGPEVRMQPALSTRRFLVTWLKYAAGRRYALLLQKINRDNATYFWN